MLKTCIFFLIFIVVSSCGKTFNLTADDLSWSPYEEGDTLFFTSNIGQHDTIAVQHTAIKVDIGKRGSGFIDHNKWEALSVYIQDTNSVNNLIAPKSRESIITLICSEEIDNCIFHFTCNLKNATIYENHHLNKNELKKMPKVSFQNNDFTLSDVYKIDCHSTNYQDRSDLITAFYWSKSVGYVRFELNNGIVWDLNKKKRL